MFKFGSDPVRELGDDDQGMVLERKEEEEELQDDSFHRISAPQGRGGSFQAAAGSSKSLGSGGDVTWLDLDNPANAVKIPARHEGRAAAREPYPLGSRALFDQQSRGSSSTTTPTAVQSRGPPGKQVKIRASSTLLPLGGRVKQHTKLNSRNLEPAATSKQTRSIFLNLDIATPRSFFILCVNNSSKEHLRRIHLRFLLASLCL